jgi:hypothetical protein
MKNPIEISIKATTGGQTLTAIYPALRIIATQNGLNLNVAREFKIARAIYERSLILN